MGGGCLYPAGSGKRQHPTRSKLSKSPKGKCQNVFSLCGAGARIVYRMADMLWEGASTLESSGQGKRRKLSHSRKSGKRIYSGVRKHKSAKYIIRIRL